MAAEAVVSGVVEKLTGLLIKQAAEQIDLLTGVEEKVRKLAHTFESIHAVLADAERKSIAEESVKLWLHRLEDVAYETDDVLDKWHYWILKQEIDVRPPVCSFTPPSCFCFKQVVVHREIAVKIKEINAKLDFIEKEKDRFRLISNSSNNGVTTNSQEWKRGQSTSFVNESEVFGRETHKNNLVSMLLNDKTDAVQILSLLGTGGVGKTTLTQLVYNDERVKGHFQARAWVCVSEAFDEIRVAKAILDSLGSSSPNSNELDSLLHKISNSISGKKFFLVLDDVWTEDETKWASLKASLNHAALGSVILLTTRSEVVGRVAGVTYQILLDKLSEPHSWSLFHRVAFSSQTNYIQGEREKLENIGRRIAKKCKGLPLALRIIGSFLRYKNTIEEWQKVMDSNLWDLEETKNKVFPHLNLSYNELPSPLRSCFSYCAVFRKNQLIQVDDLVKMWAAQGYLNSSRSEEEIEVYGRECFENLAMRSLFQDFDSDEYDKIKCCKMHDIVHDFAQYLRERECLAIEGGKTTKFSENPCHITWSGGEQATNTLFCCKLGQARSFFASGVKFETLTTVHLLNNLKVVKILSLCLTHLEELPSEIGNLIHLRYLDLNHNQLKELPKTVYNLYNLQTLNLSYCDHLLELPPGIEKLKNLRHLITTGSMKFPVGIRELTNLRTLSDLEVGNDYNKLGYLKNLNQLRESLNIEIMDNLYDMVDVQDANLRSKKHIKKLRFRFYRGVTIDVMEALEPPPNLQELALCSYRGTLLPRWIASLNNLVKLELWSCIELTSLHPLSILSSLEKLEIYFFYQLKSVGPAFWGIKESLTSLAIGFPKLLELKFSGCQEWEYWEDISLEEENDIAPLMPHLCRLVINHCSNLKVLPCRLLRKALSLESIELDGHKFNPSKFLFVAETLAEVKIGQPEHQSLSTNEEAQVKEARPTLRPLLYSKDDEELFGLLLFLSRNKNDEIQAVIEAGLYEPLVDLLRHPSPSLLELALDAIMHIAKGDDLQKQCLIDHGVLPRLLSLLLTNNHHQITTFACITISRITDGNKDQIQAVINAGLIATLLDQFSQDRITSIDAGWPIANVTCGGTHEQIKFLVSQGCVNPLCHALYSFPCHPHFLKAVEKILEVGEVEKNQGNTGDVTYFKQLIQQSHGLHAIQKIISRGYNDDHRKKAAEILERYWPEEEEET